MRRSIESAETEGAERAQPSEDGAVAAHSVSVAKWTLASRATGFLRAAVVAAVLGPTYLGNTFQASNFLPNITFEFFTGSLIAALLVPTLVRHVDLRDQGAVERIASGFMGAVLVGLLAVTVAAMLAGHLIVRLLALQAGSGAVAHAQQRVGLLLLFLLMPQVMLYAIAGTGAALMNAHGRFALAAAAPALENIGIMVTMLTIAVVYGTGVSIETIRTPEVIVLGVGTTVAVAAHACAQWLGAYRLGIRLLPRAGWRDDDVRYILRRTLPSLGYGSLNAARYLGVTVLANGVPGGVVAYYFGQNFFALPTAIGARPVALALLPRLARLHQARAWRLFHDELMRGAGAVAFLTIPAAVAFLVLAYPLSHAAAFGHMAGPGGVSLLALALIGLAPGVIGESGFVLATHASYARGNADAPFLAMVLRMAVSMAGMIAASLAFTGKTVLLALALAMSLGNIVGVGYLGRRVEAGLTKGSERLAPAVLRSIVASILMVGPAYLVAVALSGWISWGPRYQIAIVIGGLVGVSGYVALQSAWRSPELAFFREGMARVRLPGPGTEPLR